jgi:hypothetical protein
MPTPISRESLNIDLASRYDKQKAGGAFNAKNIVIANDSVAPSASPSHQGKVFTRDSGGFRVKMPVGLSSFSDIPDRKNSTSKELSSYVKGISNKKYKP